MKATKKQIREAARRYLKVIEWSEEDGCYVGSAPPLIGQSCHGATEVEVAAQLQTIVEEWVETMLTDGTPLPDPERKKKYSGNFIVRVPPEVHRAISLRASARGESLNQYVARTLANA